MVRPVNQHDNLLFNESFFGLIEAADLFELDISGSYLTTDSGFDSLANRVTILGQGLIPVIKPNPRSSGSSAYFQKRLEEFEQYRNVYHQRFIIERSFAWEDTYRKLVIRYEKLQAIHMGFKYLAYSMINLRWFIGKT